MDWMVQEQERGITITSAATTAFWHYNGHVYQINLIDTPGHVDFTVEVERSLRVLDGTVATFCAVGRVSASVRDCLASGGQVRRSEYRYVNKMDRIGADFLACAQEIYSKLGATAVPICLPIGAEDKFKGIIDLVSRNAYYYDFGEELVNYEIKDVPEDMAGEVEKWRDKLVEAAAEWTRLSWRSISRILTPSPRRRSSPPSARLRSLCRSFRMLCGSSFKNKGVQFLLDAVMRYLPSPLDKGVVKGIDPQDREEEIRHASRPAVLRSRVQDRYRSVRRPSGLRAGLLGTS